MERPYTRNIMQIYWECPSHAAKSKKPIKVGSGYQIFQVVEYRYSTSTSLVLTLTIIFVSFTIFTVLFSYCLTIISMVLELIPWSRQSFQGGIRIVVRYSSQVFLIKRFCVFFISLSGCTKIIITNFIFYVHWENLFEI